MGCFSDSIQDKNNKGGEEREKKIEENKIERKTIKIDDKRYN